MHWASLWIKGLSKPHSLDLLYVEICADWLRKQGKGKGEEKQGKERGGNARRFNQYHYHQCHYNHYSLNPDHPFNLNHHHNINHKKFHHHNHHHHHHHHNHHYYHKYHKHFITIIIIVINTQYLQVTWNIKHTNNKRVGSPLLLVFALAQLVERLHHLLQVGSVTLSLHVKSRRRSDVNHVNQVPTWHYKKGKENQNM